VQQNFAENLPDMLLEVIHHKHNAANLVGSQSISNQSKTLKGGDLSNCSQPTLAQRGQQISVCNGHLIGHTALEAGAATYRY